MENSQTQTPSVSNENKYTYGKCIALKKGALSTLANLTGFLSKHALDDVGRSIRVSCIDNAHVELRYVNAPFSIRMVLDNPTGKTVSDFAIKVSTLAKILSTTNDELLIVEQNNQLNIPLLGSLLYLEAFKAPAELYAFEEKATTSELNVELATYLFTNVGSKVLNLTDRASERNIIVKDNACYANTGLFCFKTCSPFQPDASFVIYKAVSDVISAVCAYAKTNVYYSVYDNVMAVSGNGLYVEMAIGGEERVKDFLLQSTEVMLSFKPEVKIDNDKLQTLVGTVKNLEYLNDIMSMEFAPDTMTMEITSSVGNKKSYYKFDLEGTSSNTGKMDITTEILQLFLGIVGNEGVYAYNDDGLCLANTTGKFVVRAI